MWPGYSCAVKCLNDGFFLNIDTTTKFLTQLTVLDLITNYKKQKYTDKEISKILTPKFDDATS